MTVLYYTYMFTRASEEERDSFCRALYYFFVPSFVERENSFSFLSSVFSFPTPAPTTKDERESKSKKEEKRRSIRPKKKKFSRKEWPPAEKRYGYYWRETKKIISARESFFVIKPRTRSLVCEIMFALQSSTFTGARVVSAKSAKTTRR